jgi:hypothetical protein
MLIQSLADKAGGVHYQASSFQVCSHELKNNMWPTSEQSALSGSGNSTSKISLKYKMVMLA